MKFFCYTIIVATIIFNFPLSWASLNLKEEAIQNNNFSLKEILDSEKEKLPPSSFVSSLTHPKKEGKHQKLRPFKNITNS
ncbi:MAG: hypothetical protein ACRYGR_07995 [Janthinobacterium lividum]